MYRLDFIPHMHFIPNESKKEFDDEPSSNKSLIFQKTKFLKRKSFIYIFIC